MHGILSLHILTPAYEVIPAKALRAPVKIYGKYAGSQLPVFTFKSMGIVYSEESSNDDSSGDGALTLVFSC